MAVVLGCAPLTLMASTSRLKYEQAGALHGARGAGGQGAAERPAGARGVRDPGGRGRFRHRTRETAHEGPFGEWPGYYSHSGPECVVRIKEIHHRDDPIVFGHQPLRPMLSFGSDLPDSAARAWDHLERSGITDITGVWGHCHGLMLVVSLKQRYAGHAKQALITANGIGSRPAACSATSWPWTTMSTPPT